MRNRILAALAFTLALSPVAFDASWAFTSKATSGFTRPAATSRPPSSAGPRSTGLGSAATSGFTVPNAPTQAGPRPAGSLDRAVSGGMAKDAYDKSIAKPQPQGQPAQPSVQYGNGGNGQGYGGQGYGNGGYQQTPPPRYDDYANTRRYDQGNGSNDFVTGAAVGALIESLARPRGYGVDQYQYQRDQEETRRRLREMEDKTNDPDLRRQIDSSLTKTVSNPVAVGGADQSTPSASVATAQKSGGHGALVFLIVLILIVAIVVGALYMTGFFSRRTGAAVAPSQPARKAAVPEDELASAPVGAFRPGGRIKLSSAPFVIASAKDSTVPDLSGAHAVQSLGRFDIYGVGAERAYFDDGKCFLERAVDSQETGGAQIRAYKAVLERTPQSVEDWHFFMGNDGSDGTEPVDAYIGLPQINLPDTDKTYDRLWGDGDQPVAPVRLVETVTDAAGHKTRVTHDAMQYYRTLDAGTPGGAPLNEYLYIARVDNGTRAVVRIWTGLDVAANAIQLS